MQFSASFSIKILVYSNDEYPIVTISAITWFLDKNLEQVKKKNPQNLPKERYMNNSWGINFTCPSLISPIKYLLFYILYLISPILKLNALLSIVIKVMVVTMVIVCRGLGYVQWLKSDGNHHY